MIPFPLVTGSPCRYCHRAPGEQHGHDCVSVVKRVRVSLTYTITMDVPHDWDEHAVYHYLNDSSACADDFLDRISEQCEPDGCSCNVFKGEQLEVVDPTPRLRP